MKIPFTHLPHSSSFTLMCLVSSFHLLKYRTTKEKSHYSSWVTCPMSGIPLEMRRKEEEEEKKIPYRMCPESEHPPAWQIFSWIIDLIPWWQLKGNIKRATAFHLVNKLTASVTGTSISDSFDAALAFISIPIHIHIYKYTENERMRERQQVLSVGLRIPAVALQIQL